MPPPHMSAQRRRRPYPRVHYAISALLFTVARTTRAEFFYSARSPAIQDGLINQPATTCPVSQDGETTDTFPWTHNPTCVNVDMANEEEDTETVTQQTFCAYTNVNYNHGRGVSFVASPEVAASVTMETFGMGIGGMAGQIGEEMGMWEVKQAGVRGKGLFAKKDVAAIFAGESLIVQTPVLFVAKTLLETPRTTTTQLVLKKAVEQLPGKTRQAVKKLDVNVDGSIEDIVVTNGVDVKWPWVDDVPVLLAVVPEVAVSLTKLFDNFGMGANMHTAHQSRMPSKHDMAVQRLHTRFRDSRAQRHQAERGDNTKLYAVYSSTPHVLD